MACSHLSASHRNNGADSTCPPVGGPSNCCCAGAAPCCGGCCGVPCGPGGGGSDCGAACPCTSPARRQFWAPSGSDKHTRARHFRSGTTSDKRHQQAGREPTTGFPTEHGDPETAWQLVAQDHGRQQPTWPGAGIPGSSTGLYGCCAALAGAGIGGPGGGGRLGGGPPMPGTKPSGSL